MIIEALHIKTPICARIPIPNDKLPIFTNYSSVNKDQTLEETVLTLFFPVIYNRFQLIGVRISIACHDVVRGQLPKVVLEGLVHTKINGNQAIPF